MAQYVYTMRRVGKVVPPKRTILKNISLNFFPGAKIGVLGVNGSGKSSLLKIMAGVDDNYDGEVVRMPGIRVGFLEQEPRLPQGKSVKEAVEESLGETAAAKKRLDEVYAAYGYHNRYWENRASRRVRGVDERNPTGRPPDDLRAVPRVGFESSFRGGILGVQ